jgi:exopolysaccharide transport family protein
MADDFSPRGGPGSDPPDKIRLTFDRPHPGDGGPGAAGEGATARDGASDRPRGRGGAGYSSGPDGGYRRSSGDEGLGHGYDDAQDGTDAHLFDYLRVLSKHRWVAITSFLLIVLSVAVHTFTVTPIYRATVQILIENEDPNVISFQEVLEQTQRTSDYYQTQYRILESRALARRTLGALDLWAHPQLNPGGGTDRAWSPVAMVRGAAGAVGGWVAGWFASGDAPVEPAAIDETAGQSAAIDRFLQGLTVTPVRNSRLVDLTFSSPDPALAADVANALARAYIDQDLEYKFLSSREATDWLAQQMAEQRKQVEVTERALQTYREQNDAVSLEDRQNIVVQKLADLNGAVTRARTERIQKEAVYNQIEAVQNNSAALDTLPAIVSNAFVQQQKAQLAELQGQRAQLSDKLGPRHPDMVKLNAAIEAARSRIESEIAKVIESLRNDYQQAQAQEQSLAAALEQQKIEALDLNRREIDYGVLARDAAANRQLFDSLMQRAKETGVSGELRTSNIRVVDEAEVPRSPAFPRKRLNLLLALAGGSLLAVGFAFFFEYLDNRIKTPDEIKRYLGLAFLGMVPALDMKAIDKANGRSPRPLLINDGVPANFSESFRALRTNLLFSSAEEGSRSIVVTSTGPGEGKSLVASNLAMALAQAGERVLLVDADMRRPRVHRIFDKPQKPGLSNVLVGDARAADTVHKTGVPGLWVMPAGVHPPNPAELLGSKRCKEFMASLEEHFDWVIVDTPPVMAVTDSAVVVHRATGVLFVVGSEMTARGAARRAVEQLEHAKGRFVGAVLNRVDLQHNAYYYSQYYRREYSEYYQTEPRA